MRKEKEVFPIKTATILCVMVMTSLKQRKKSLHAWKEETIETIERTEKARNHWNHKHLLGHPTMCNSNDTAKTQEQVIACTEASIIETIVRTQNKEIVESLNIFKCCLNNRRTFASIQKRNHLNHRAQRRKIFSIKTTTIPCVILTTVLERRKKRFLPYNGRKHWICKAKRSEEIIEPCPFFKHWLKKGQRIESVKERNLWNHKRRNNVFFCNNNHDQTMCDRNDNSQANAETSASLESGEQW